MELPVDSKIDHVFYVSCLKNKLGKSVTLVMEFPGTRKDGQLLVTIVLINIKYKIVFLKFLIRGVLGFCFSFLFKVFLF